MKKLLLTVMVTLALSLRLTPPAYADPGDDIILFGFAYEVIDVFYDDEDGITYALLEGGADGGPDQLEIEATGLPN